MIIFNPEDEVHGVQALQGKTPNEQKLINGLLGARTLSSNYQLMAAEIQATPADLKWWAPRASNVREWRFAGVQIDRH